MHTADPLLTLFSPPDLIGLLLLGSYRRSWAYMRKGFRGKKEVENISNGQRHADRKADGKTVTLQVSENWLLLTNLVFVAGAVCVNYNSPLVIFH